MSGEVVEIRPGFVATARLLPWPAMAVLAGCLVVLVATVIAPAGERPTLAGAAIVAGLAGLSATSVGVFGSVLVPGLLLLGLDPRSAAAISLLAQVLVIPIGASSHAAVGHVKRAILLPIVLGGVTGSVIGALLASTVPAALAGRAVAVMIVVIGLIVLANLRAGASPAGDGVIRPRRTAGIGLVAGLASGISGAGWGPIGVKLLILGGTLPRIAIGSSLAGRVPMAIAALVTYAVSASAHGIPAAPPTLVAVVLGASLVTMIPGTLLIAHLGRRSATVGVALLSIALALPTVVAWR